MAKKIFAVTNIKTGAGEPDGPYWFDAGSEVDAKKFTKEQLLQLHELGAIEIRDVGDPVAEVAEEAAETAKTEEPTPVTPEAPVVENPETDPGATETTTETVEPTE